MKALFARNVPEVLTVLFIHKGEALHQSKIAEETGLRLIQIQRVLQKMLEEGIIEEQKRGNMSCYLLNASYPLLTDIKNILIKSTLVAEPFQKALASQSKNIDMAFIHGSFATGLETPTSDIDVIIVGDTSLKSLSKLLSPLSLKLQREINPVVYSRVEFIKKIKAKDHFVTSVLRTKKLWLKGSNNELEEMGK